MDRLHFVVHTHWDREWYQPFQQMRARLVKMADRMIPLVERGEIPFFHFDGQTIVVEDYLELRPAMEKRLRTLIRGGKIQIGPWYVLADSFLVSGESLIRNLEIGIAMARRFGRPLDVGYLPDQFGHIAQMPQILAGFGFDSALLWRGVGADVERNQFRWEALDGSAVRTIYLPFSYANGANLPLESVETFLKRTEGIAERERAFADGAPVLVMAGTDHAEPDPRLATRINEAREMSSMEFELGTLKSYVNRTESSGLATHRGELRSPLRAYLLPGVTSARNWIKQRDFQNCVTLERFADPLAAMAHTIGRGDGLNDFLDLAWRMELQNHPHDSICGCSVDQVHNDMRYRFDQAAMIADTVIHRATAALIGRDAISVSPEITVFNPTFSHVGLVAGEIELQDAAGRYFLEASDGSKIPAAVDSVHAERATEAEFRAAEFQTTVASLSQPSLLGRTVNRFEISGDGNSSPKLTLYLSRAPHSELDLEQFRDAVRANLPDSGTVRIRAVNARSCRIEFVASDLKQVGFMNYRLSREDADVAIRPDSRGWIENEFYRVQPSTQGLEIRDKSRGITLELFFEDVGDRGDEYNFDPLPGDLSIMKPATISPASVEVGTAREKLAMTIAYDLPASLGFNRLTRSPESEKLTVDLTASLYPGLERIDFAACVQNRSRDHRFRAALRTPIQPGESIHDTSFGAVRRSPDPTEQAGDEAIYPTGPHRTFTAIESAECSAALMSRGIYEAEVRREAAGSTIALTLLRCVGWLSRSDLGTRRTGAGPELETPGAQEIGEHRFEFAVTTYRGLYADAGLIERSQAYAYPARIISAAASSSGSMTPSLIGCDNPRVAFSTARPLDRARCYRARVFSMSDVAEQVRFSFPPGSVARPVDLAGRRLRPKGLRRDADGSLALQLRPFQIVTFEVGSQAAHDVKKNSSNEGQKH